MSILTESQIQANINSDITTNGAGAITGAQLNTILNDMNDTYFDHVNGLTQDTLTKKGAADKLVDSVFSDDGTDGGISGNLVIAATKGVLYGDGDSGVIETSDDNLEVQLSSSTRFIFNANDFRANATNGPTVKNAVGGSVVFTFKGDEDTGIQRTSANVLGLVAGAGVANWDGSKIYPNASNTDLQIAGSGSGDVALPSGFSLTITENEGIKEAQSGNKNFLAQLVDAGFSEYVANYKTGGDPATKEDIDSNAVSGGSTLTYYWQPNFDESIVEDVTNRATITEATSWTTTKPGNADEIFDSSGAQTVNIKLESFKHQLAVNACSTSASALISVEYTWVVEHYVGAALNATYDKDTVGLETWGVDVLAIGDGQCPTDSSYDFGLKTHDLATLQLTLAASDHLVVYIKCVIQDTGGSGNLTADLNLDMYHNARLKIEDASGTGTNFNLELQGLESGIVVANDPFRLANYAQTQLPSALVGAGQLAYDTTSNFPVFSDGNDWRNLANGKIAGLDDVLGQLKVKVGTFTADQVKQYGAANLADFLEAPGANKLIIGVRAVYYYTHVSNWTSARTVGLYWAGTSTSFVALTALPTSGGADIMDSALVPTQADLSITNINNGLKFGTLNNPGPSGDGSFKVILFYVEAANVDT